MPPSAFTFELVLSGRLSVRASVRLHLRVSMYFACPLVYGNKCVFPLKRRCVRVAIRIPCCRLPILVGKHHKLHECNEEAAVLKHS